MIYKYYVYQNDFLGPRQYGNTQQDDVLYQYKTLESDLKVLVGVGSEVIITRSSHRIGVLLNIDSNKSRDEVGFLLRESLKRLNRLNPRLSLAARLMEG